jgi:hypothetical protein
VNGLVYQVTQRGGVRRPEGGWGYKRLERLKGGDSLPGSQAHTRRLGLGGNDQSWVSFKGMT